jgi:hypothetical protein
MYRRLAPASRRSSCARNSQHNELERFSLILFNRFKRKLAMLKHGNYDGRWSESMRSA